MGCSGSVCSISSVAIESGEKAVIIPISSVQNIINSEGMGVPILGRDIACYPYDIFAPETLPIEGIYDDYGSIKNIVKSSNTKYIESYFDMSIEDFVRIITSGRGRSMTDTCDDIFEFFVKDRNGIDNFPYVLDRELLINFGFIEHKGFFFNTSLGFAVEFIKERVIEEGKVIEEGLINVYFSEKLKQQSLSNFEKCETFEIVLDYDSSENFISWCYEKSSRWVHIKPEDHDLLEKIKNITFMIVHGDIYEEMSKYGFKSEKEIRKMIDKKREFIIKRRKLWEKVGETKPIVDEYFNCLVLSRAYQGVTEGFVKIYLNAFIDTFDEDFFSIYVKANNFTSNMFKIGRYYMMSGTGSQNSFTDFRLGIFKKAIEITNEQQKRLLE